VENTVRTEATFGKSALGKKSKSATGRARKIENAQNTGDFSDRVAALENLSIRELAGSLKFAG
jgi:hypothetical protein